MLRSYLKTVLTTVNLLFVFIAITLIGFFITNESQSTDDFEIGFAVNTAFGDSRLASAEDVPEESKIHSQVPCSTALELEWYRNHLGSDTKIALYETIKAAIQSLRYEISVPSLPEEDVKECFWAVVYDHPEFFWVDNHYTYYYDSDGLVNAFDMNFSVESVQQAEEALAKYEIMADTIIAGAEYPKSDRNIMKQIYLWIGNNTTYKSGNGDQHMASVFDYHESVCAGYVQAQQFIALRAGIPCTRIMGHPIGEDGQPTEGDHTWLVAVTTTRLKCYDITWGDKGYSVNMEKWYEEEQEEFCKDHAIASDKAPQCIGERNDSRELVETAVELSTGDHLIYLPSSYMNDMFWYPDAHQAYVTPDVLEQFSELSEQLEQISE